MEGKTYFVTGIDTDAGKTYCTAWLANRLVAEGMRVITQKFVQTGCEEYSEDIETHRRLMGCGMFPEDIDHTTAPVIYRYPCSPHMAAKMENRPIDLEAIENSSVKLAQRYDVVLIEGAGGMMVPLSDEMLTIDYPVSRKLPVILVTHGILGSINHTLLSLEAIRSRGLELPYVLYNEFFDSRDPKIAGETLEFLKRYLAKNFPATELLVVPDLTVNQ